MPTFCFERINIPLFSRKVGNKDESNIVNFSLKHLSNSTLYGMARNLAQVFHSETNGHWNVIIMKNETAHSGKIGFNFPKYTLDSRSGICIGTIADQYIIIASIIGFENQHEELLSDG